MSEILGFRDAIHVPYIVLKCNGALMPGQKCSLRGDRYEEEGISCVPWIPGDGANEFGDPPLDWHGVADPFRETPIVDGDLFRLYIRKECFSGMTHAFQIEVHDRGGTATCHSVCNIY